MGLLEIENMEFYSYHGCFNEERIIGNCFIVDLKLEIDMTKACQSDDINDTLSYPVAYEIIKTEMEQPSNLIEHVADRILNALYAKTKGIEKAQVKISKMAPPIGGKIERVSVTLSK